MRRKITVVGAGNVGATVAQEIAAFSGQFMLVYLEAALIYWLICLVLSGGQSRLEKRLDRYVAH